MGKHYIVIAGLLLVGCGPRTEFRSSTVAPMPTKEEESVRQWRVDPSLADIYGEPPASGRMPTKVNWSADSKKIAYLRLSKRDGGVMVRELWLNDLTRNLETPLFADAKRSVTKYSWCGSSSVVVVAGGDLYRVRVDDSEAKQLTETKSAETNAICSPDGAFAAFVRDHNLYLLDLATHMERPLLTGGSRERTIGETTWLYQEEFETGSGFGWSPDSKSLWVYATDLGKVPFRVILQSDGSARSMAYPRAGEPNPIVKVGVIDLDGTDNKVNWLALGTPSSDAYIPQVLWHPDGEHLLITRIDRLQTTLDLLMCDKETSLCNTVVTERDPRFVNLLGEPLFIGNGKEILWLSEREGFSHIYRVTLDGASQQALTAGTWEVKEINGIDSTQKYVLFTCNVESPGTYTLFRVPLAGGEVEKLPLESGSHRVKYAPDMTRFIDTHSALDRVPRCEIKDASNRRVASLASTDVGDYKIPNVQTDMFPIETSDGRRLMAMMTKPKIVEKDVRYPVVVIVYGGPRVQVVKNAFHALYQPWRDLLAERGILVFSVDGRGSAGRGVEFERAIRLHLGKVELEDQLEGIAYLRSLPMVDPERIAVFGWSYGGTMALSMLLNAEKTVKMGVAVAPVTDWRLYDTAYTERYMQRPKDNPNGYDESSVLKRARHLTHPLLLVHGVADENVHFVHSQQMVDTLVNAGAHFKTLFYPGRGHKLSDSNTRVHLFSAVTQFLEEGL